MKLKEITLLSILCSSLAISQNNTLLDELYKKAFANKSEKSSKIFLPLVVNKREHTELFAIIKNSVVSIKKEDVEYILNLLKDEYKKKFTFKPDKDGYIELNQLNQEGLLATFNEEKVYLNITIPPKLKKAQLINFQQKREMNIDGAILPEKYSGGVNLFFNHNMYTNESGSLESAPISGSSEIFLNAFDFHLEGQVTYIQNRETPFQKERVRVVKDDEEHQIRYQAGDIFLPQNQRLAIQDTLGVGFEKVFDMDDNYLKNVSKINSFEFFLKNSSRVEIYVNGRYTRSLHLPAGTHNLYDLNIPNGLSTVELKIIEDTGKIEYIDFRDFDYNELYKVGVSRYGGGVGIIVNRLQNRRVYQQDEKFLSLYGEYGFLPFLTLKSGLQAKQDFYSYVLEPIVGTPIGLFDIYTLISTQKKVNKGSGTKFGIHYRTNIGQLNLSFLAEKTDENFRTITNYQDTTPHSAVTMYQGNIYTPLIAGSYLSLSASQYEEFNKQQQNYSIGLTKSFTQNLELQLNYSQLSLPLSDNTNREIYLTLNYRLNNSSLRYDHYNEEKKDFLNLSHRTDGYYNIASSIDFENNPINQRVALREDIRNEKFRFNTNYTYSKQKTTTQTNQNISSQLSTALLFAGDTWTISEPISTSYIIVDNDESLKEHPLGVKGYQDGDDYIYDSFAIQTTDYRTRTLTVNEESLDMGTTLENSEQTFFSKYRTGSKMKIKIKSLFSLKGKLVDQNNQPISLRAFKVFNISSGTKEMLFTNDNGDFVLEDAKSGEYNAVLFRQKDEDGIAKFSFVFDKSKYKKEENIINIGTIKVKLPKKKKISKKLLKK